MESVAFCRTEWMKSACGMLMWLQTCVKTSMLCLALNCVLPLHVMHPFDHWPLYTESSCSQGYPHPHPHPHGCAVGPWHVSARKHPHLTQRTHTYTHTWSLSLPLTQSSDHHQVYNTCCLKCASRTWSLASAPYTPRPVFQCTDAHTHAYMHAHMHVLTYLLHVLERPQKPAYLVPVLCPHNELAQQ